MVPNAARRARRRGKTILAALVVVLVLLSTYLTITLRYELHQGNFGANPQALSSATAGPYTEYRYLAQPGRSIEYGFSIANRGPLTIRLKEVTKDGGPGYVVDQVHVNMDVNREGFERGKATPFEPIDLPAGDQIFVWVTLRFSEDLLLNYQPPCAGFSFATHEVRFNVLGMQREQRVPIGYFIRVETPDADGRPCRSDE
ncbi:hypothetical protein F8279_23860 [Micromonospora sp. AMSO1212t]|uniref:hypothetical protein n=1 Tax=Micromonospora sp. AMSO1212t TaxID=2650565 RepID=UPI00124B2C1E|nr:hypothetical protein [Micromonospora sp. AMSO1212t]KAB1903299.1 hypothetical protein F8279_23860 [Micromonospora sp. AMSO1212t]